MRTIGVKVMGVRAPVIKQGDDLAGIVVDSLVKAATQEGFRFNDRDVVGVTEAVLARAQGNYATVDQIARCMANTFTGTVGCVFPILSRNRFAIMLKGMAQGVEKLVVQLSYPADEVGNALIEQQRIDEAGLNPFTDALTSAQFHEMFGPSVHKFTGMDYIDYYQSLGDNIEVVLCNDPRHILQYTNNVVAGDIHTRRRTQAMLKAAGANVVAMDELMTQSVDGSGYNAQFGLLGANKAGEERVKLFPRDCDAFVNDVQARLKSATGKEIEVLVYGDGGFKDPVGGIWELADPVVSPGFTKGLNGTPNELKLKYLADTTYADLKGEELSAALRDAIRNKGEESLVGNMQSEGTTPRRLTDLLGSLCDLTSGSGDKGTPFVLVQGYFDNYAD